MDPKPTSNLIILCRKAMSHGTSQLDQGICYFIQMPHMFAKCKFFLHDGFPNKQTNQSAFEARFFFIRKTHFRPQFLKFRKYFSKQTIPQNLGKITSDATFYAKREKRIISETALPTTISKFRKHFLTQATPQNLGKITSDTTFLKK